MNKNDVYKLIGYRGEYNANVKKAIRKLLKENHPDNKGDRKKFEIIQEVKKELESGKVSYTEKDSFKVSKDIDYDYCLRKIDELKDKKDNLNNLMNNKKEILNKYADEYKNLYQTSLDIENNLLVNSPYIKKAQNIKTFSIILLILMIIVFSVSIINKGTILFVVFIILSIICILVVQRYLNYVHKMTESSKNRFKEYLKMNAKIRKNIHKQNDLKKEIYDIKKRINNVENDLRFYKNLLK